ncbi:hypothetical protein FRB91_003404 [Serendipita sp. 411]|nr:hypothetical protein FRB91_003404 [Serendipita sp. 411]
MDDDDDRALHAALRLPLLPRQLEQTSSNPALYPTTPTTTQDDLNGSNPPIEPLLPPSRRSLVLTPWQIALVISGPLLALGLCFTLWILFRTRRRLRHTGASTSRSLSISSRLGIPRGDPSRRWRRSMRRGSRSLESGEELNVPVIGKHYEEGRTWEDTAGEEAENKIEAKDKGKNSRAVETRVRLTRLLKKQPRPSTGLTVSSSVTGRSRATLQTNTTDANYAAPVSTEYDPAPSSTGPTIHPKPTDPLERQASNINEQVAPLYHGSPPFRQSEDNWGLRTSSVAHTIRGSFEGEEGQDVQSQMQDPLRSPRSTAFDHGHSNRLGQGEMSLSYEGALSSNGDHSSPLNSGGSLLRHGSRTEAPASDGIGALAFSGSGLFGSGHYRTDHERNK